MKSTVNIRIGNLILVPKSNSLDYEIRGTTNDETDQTHWIVAWFIYHKEGYDLKTLSDRPYSVPHFWESTRIFYNILMQVRTVEDWQSQEDGEA